VNEVLVGLEWKGLIGQQLQISGDSFETITDFCAEKGENAL